MEFNGETVARRLRELAYLNAGVRFVFTDERVKDPEARVREYCYARGLRDFLQYLNNDKNTIGEPCLLYTSKAGCAGAGAGCGAAAGRRTGGNAH